MPSAPDPYLPGHGDSRYAVEHYDLSLDYKLATNRLDGVAVLRVRTLEPTASVKVDLAGLHVDKLKVDGKKAGKYAHKGKNIEVKLPSALDAGENAVLEIAYSGKPGPLRGVHGAAGWEELTDGVLVASQPHGAPSWFPCNDRADDKASYRIAVTSDAEYLSLASGLLVSETTRAGRTTRTFEMDEPTSSYLVALHLGRLGFTTLGHRVDLASPRAVALRPDATVRLLPQMLRQLEEWYGRYPFTRFTAVVVDDVLEIPLEAQASASFGRNHLAPTWDNERLVVHELAHQWFGNAVTAKLLKDIWLHEGFACYTEWLWSEVRGFESTQERARKHWQALRMAKQPTPLSDPGMRTMFDDWVYKRGALTLHALRCAIGDEAFFRLLQTWVAENAGGVVDTAGFLALVRRNTPVPIDELFAEWLDEVPLPALPTSKR